MVTKLLVLILLAGCSVNVGTVENKPPLIEARVTTQMHHPEYGTLEFNDLMDMDGISMFLWPEPSSMTASREPSPNCIARLGPNYQPSRLSDSDKMSIKVCQVNTYSGGIDAEFGQLQAKLPALDQSFRDRNCPALSTTADAAIGAEVEWQPMEAGDPREAQLSSCKELKDQYTSLIAEAYAKIADLKTKLTDEIGAENWIEADKRLSSLAIGPSRVELTVNVAGVTYSTKSGEREAQMIRNANYDSGFRLLTFEFNQLDADRNPTGLVYRFALERIEALKMARFTGDMKLVDAATGKTIRNGSAQISGQVSSNTAN